MTTAQRYQEPGWITRNVMNRSIRRLTRVGISVMGSRELRVRGRSSGQWRTTPVNLLNYDGADYLVSPRGHTQWVRNLRASGTGELRLGRRTREFTAVELTGDEKIPVLRTYLTKWAWEVGVFFENLDKNSSDAELAAAAPNFPAFRISQR